MDVPKGGDLPIAVRFVLLAAFHVPWVIVAIYQLYRLWYIIQYLRHYRTREEPGDLPEELPHVTVQLPMFNEFNVAERVIRASCALEWPKEKLDIQVLDDSTDDSKFLVQRTCQEMRDLGFDCQAVQREKNVGYKAGALDYGLKICKGEFIAIFDADFIPTSDFLARCMPFFYDKGGIPHASPVGVVQGAWGYLNRYENILTRAQSMWLDGHFFCDQLIRMKSVKVFNFNGTAGMWRKKAIEDAGGWSWDTVTEDAELSYRTAEVGYQFRFVKDCVQGNEVPANMIAFKQQQRRWAKGHSQIMRKMWRDILRSKQALRVKIDVVSTITGNVNYLASFFILTMAPWMFWLQLIPSWLVVIYCVPLSITVAYYAVAWFERACVVQGDVSTVIAYLASVWHIAPLLALFTGMAIVNTAAFIEGYLSKDATFIRTPKEGSKEVDHSEQQSQEKVNTEVDLIWEVGVEHKSVPPPLWMSVKASVMTHAEPPCTDERIDIEKAGSLVESRASRSTNATYVTEKAGSLVPARVSKTTNATNVSKQTLASKIFTTPKLEKGTRKYKPKVSWTAWVELMMILYFSGLTVFFIYVLGQWVAMASVAWICLSFAWTSGYSSLLALKDLYMCMRLSLKCNFRPSCSAVRPHAQQKPLSLKAHTRDVESKEKMSRTGIPLEAACEHNIICM
eukprot:CAMPEP_0169203630 /NCGR_PEP_ID=MMETSP1016-20121227/11567_1 /TAXON_ID=342587 /ORGANISM="Karlodinium micrum, Strain CCMP2283" /LENGTH=677 /DNA_ID=CAMNT_0009280683 /DNA_START=39 /DNA_END=2072 /DNA_ORIENTATION=+